MIDASKPKDGLRRVHKRISNVQYFLEHRNGYFYVLTNAPIRENIPCENYYLGIFKAEDIESATWQVRNLNTKAYFSYYFRYCLRDKNIMYS